MVSNIAQFIRQIRAGAPDEGAGMALWQAVRWNRGPVHFDLCDPQLGWNLKIEGQANNERYLTLTAEGAPEKQAGRG
jgi:hypothetical protein